MATALTGQPALKLVWRSPVDLRVATLPGKYGEKLVVRIIDNDRGAINLERLGFSYDTLKQWRVHKSECLAEIKRRLAR